LLGGGLLVAITLVGCSGAGGSPHPAVRKSHPRSGRVGASALRQ